MTAPKLCKNCKHFHFPDGPMGPRTPTSINMHCYGSCDAVSYLSLVTGERVMLGDQTHTLRLHLCDFVRSEATSHREAWVASGVCGPEGLLWEPK